MAKLDGCNLASIDGQSNNQMLPAIGKGQDNGLQPAFRGLKELASPRSGCIGLRELTDFLRRSFLRISNANSGNMQQDVETEESSPKRRSGLASCWWLDSAKEARSKDK